MLTELMMIFLPPGGGDIISTSGGGEIISASGGGDVVLASGGGWNDYFCPMGAE